MNTVKLLESVTFPDYTYLEYNHPDRLCKLCYQVFQFLADLGNTRADEVGFKAERLLCHYALNSSLAEVSCTKAWPELQFSVTVTELHGLFAQSCTVVLKEQ